MSAHPGKVVPPEACHGQSGPFQSTSVYKSRELGSGMDGLLDQAAHLHSTD